MLREDLEKLTALGRLESFKLLRAKINTSIDITTRLCVDKDNTASLEDLRYLQGQIVAWQRILAWVDAAPKELARKTGEK